MKARYAFLLVALVARFSFAQERTLEERLNELQSAIEVDIEVFEIECGDFEVTNIISENCIAVATRIGEAEQEIANLLASLEESMALGVGNCGGPVPLSPLEGGNTQELINTAEEAARTECFQGEIDETQTNCFGEIKCVLSSVVLPFSLGRKEGCVSRENNCLAHVAQAAVDLVWTSIKDIGGLIKGAAVGAWNWLWGVEDETSDTQGAIQDLSREEVEEASEDPEGFFTRMMKGITSMFMEWVRTDLFCEEWEGEPHFGECTRPMVGWECLGCGAKIKGVCASFGAIGGLLLESIATGGVASLLTKGVKGGSLALKALKTTEAYKNSIRGTATTARSSVGQAIGQVARGSGRAAVTAGQGVARGLRESFVALKGTGIFDKASALLARARTTLPGRAVTMTAGAVGRGLKNTGKGILAVDDAAFDLGWNAVDNSFEVAAKALRGKRIATAGVDLSRFPIALHTNLTDSERLAESERVLGRELNPTQRQAVIDTHNIGAGEIGLNGQMSEIGNYTPTQIARKARRLREAGFDRTEARRLMENGLVGTPPSGRLLDEQLSFLESLHPDKRRTFTDLLNAKGYTGDEIQDIFAELKHRSGNDSFDPKVFCR